MKILITNDDGINSIGLHMLVKEMEKNHEVLIVAPDNQRSASGHAITIDRPLIMKEVKIEGVRGNAYSVDGTPADCVKFAVEKLSKGKIDMIISGINRGLNLATDVIYSGTVSAAIEGAIYKIPSMAVSTEVTDEEEKYGIAAKYAERILLKAFRNLQDNDIVLNINVPGTSSIKGIKVCNLGNRIYNNCYVEKQMDNETKGYMLTGEPKDELIENTDVYYMQQGFVTVTPLHYDLTNFKIIKEVDQWFEK